LEARKRQAQAALVDLIMRTGKLDPHEFNHCCGVLCGLRPGRR
jgi:hypothetical protein